MEYYITYETLYKYKFLNDSEIALICKILNLHFNTDNGCIKTIKKLAELFNKSESTIRKQLKKLEDLELILIEPVYLDCSCKLRHIIPTQILLNMISTEEKIDKPKSKKTGYLCICPDILNNKGLNPTEMCICQEIWNYNEYGKSKMCYLTNEQFAQKYNISVDTVKRTLKKLESKGMIGIVKKSRRTRYLIKK